MRALLPTGCPDSLVEFGDIPRPSPAPGEALVAVEAFSINRGETFLLERPARGWRPGKDIAGRVVQSARDGSGPVVGERVVGHPRQAGWAQLAPVPTSSLTVLPKTVSMEVAAALPLAGLTGLRLVRASGPLAGTRMLITGASGGVGHYVTELAAAAGAAVTVVTGSPRRAERLLALGAIAAVRDLDEARGPFDVVLESVGGDSLPRAFGLLVARGALIWFGQASREPVTLDFFAYFAQTGATIRHFHYEDTDVCDARDLHTLVRLVATGRLHPELGVVADWAQAADTIEALRARQIRGNAVLTIPTAGRPSHRQQEGHHARISR